MSQEVKQAKHTTTMKWPQDLYDATVALAHQNRRSFTAEACVALEEHLSRAGIVLAAPNAPTNQQPPTSN